MCFVCVFCVWGGGRGGSEAEREKHCDGLENMDPGFLTPLFVSECKESVLDVSFYL